MAEQRSTVELLTGIFLALGLVCVSWLAIRLGDISVLAQDRYHVIARFTSASGLRAGAHVEAGGVRIGLIDRIEFDPQRYQAVVTLAIDDGVPIQEDAVASVRTAGIIGDKFVKITPGGSDRNLGPGDEILDTEPSINLEELISKYIFESGK